MALNLARIPRRRLLSVTAWVDTAVCWRGVDAFAESLKKIRPRDLAVPGPNLGVGVRHALFPGGTLLGASLSRAVCSPTPLSAACGCLGLMAGPFRPFPVGIFRVRPLRPVRTLPAGSGSPDVVQTRLQFLIVRVGTVATGTAPAFGRTLAPRYGSDLLTLRLRSLLQWGDALFRAAPIEEVDGLCQARSLPAVAPPLRALLVRASGAFWRGGPAGKRNCVLVCAVATKTLWGNCVSARIETSRGPDLARARFLIAPRLSAPDSC